MFNRKLNWRATIVGLASLALLATFPLSTVTASAEISAHAPSSTVKPAAAGSTSFRSVGQDRSASSAIGESRYNRETGLWTLSAEGDIIHYKHDAGRSQKYKADDADTIPAKPKLCNGGSHVNPQGIENSGVFDGLGIDIRDNGSGPKPYGMYAVYGRSSGGASALNQKESGVTIYHRDNNLRWYAYKLQKEGRSWKIKRQEVGWNYCSGSSVSANFTPSVRSGDPKGTGSQNSYNYTFDRAGTDFTSGAVVPHSVGGIGGTYIFGGPADSYQKGKQEKIIKLFAFQTGSNGDGVVKYLGFIPTGNAPHNFNGDFTFDKQGNLYVSAAKITQNDASNPEVRVFKVPVANLKNAISTGFKQFSFNGPNHWGSGEYDSFGFYSSKANSGSFQCSGVGGTDRGQCFAREVNSKEIYRKTIQPKKGTRYDWFAGVDISPDKNLTVGVAGTANRGAAVPVIIEVDKNGKEVAKAGSFYNTYSNDQIKNDVSGAVYSRRLTDFVGSLWSETTPAQPRWLTLHKKVENRVGNDQFQVDLNPLGAHNGQSDYAINRRGYKTSFTRTDEEQQIGERTQIPNGVFKARIGERAFRNGNRFDITKSYSTTLKCYNSVGTQLVSPVFTIDKHEDSEDDQNRYFDITLASSVTGEISCKLVNTGSEPTAPSTPNAQVTVYKNFKSFHNDSDTFTVGLSHNGQEHKSNTTTQYVADDTYFYPMVSGVSVPAGDTITVFEKNLTGRVSDYDVDMSCRQGTLENPGDPISGTPSLLDNDTKSALSIQVPTQLTASKKIFCVVINADKSTDKIVYIHERFDRRYVYDDNFKASAYIADPYYDHVDISTTGFGEENKGKDFSSERDSDENLRAITVPGDAIITVDQIGIRHGFSDPSVLTGYDVKIECSTSAGQLVRESRGAQTQGSAKKFDLSQSRLKRIDCYVTNKAKEKPARTITFEKVFKNTDNTAGFHIRAFVGFPEEEVFETFDTGEARQEGNQPSGQFKIVLGSRKIPIRDGKIRVGLYENIIADEYNDLTGFNISMKCSNGTPAHDTVISGVVGGGNQDAWFTNNSAVLPASLVGDITCTLTNERLEQKTNLVVLKQLKRFNPNDNFDISVQTLAQPTDDYGSELGEANTGSNLPIENQIDGSSVYSIGKSEYSRTGKSVNILFEESAKNGANFNNYNSDVVCKAVSDTNVSSDLPVNISKTVTSPDGSVRNIRASFSGAGSAAKVSCYLRNTAKPKVNVVLYKELKGFNPNDAFDIGLATPAAIENGGKYFISPVNTAKLGLDKTQSNDYSVYKLGNYEYAQADTSFNFRVEESAHPGTDPVTNLTNYTPSLTCKAVGTDGVESTSLLVNSNNVSLSNNKFSIEGAIPATQTGEVHCYLRNEPKPKTKVVLFKDLKRVNENDQFRVQLTAAKKYMPDLAQKDILKFSIRNSSENTSNYRVADATESKILKLDSGYTRYKVGEVSERPGSDYVFEIVEYDGTNSSVPGTSKFVDYQSSITCKAVNGDEITPLTSAEAFEFGTGTPQGVEKEITNSPITGGTSRYIRIPQTQEGEVHCFLRNEPDVKGSITIHKISSVTRDDLAGSHWKVQQKIGNNGSFKDYGVIADDDTTMTNQLHDADNRPGYIKIANLQIGTEAEPITYKVIETVAPVGYTISRAAAFGPEKIFDGTSFNPNDRTIEITNAPATVPELPFTGGWGTLPYMILGFVLTGGAVVAFVIAKPKKH